MNELFNKMIDDAFEHIKIKQKDKRAKWKITFENGYYGCDVTEEFEGTYKEAVSFAQLYLPDYADKYSHWAFGFDNQVQYEDVIYQQYLDDCLYHINEMEVVDE